MASSKRQRRSPSDTPVSAPAAEPKGRRRKPAEAPAISMADERPQPVESGEAIEPTSAQQIVDVGARHSPADAPTLSMPSLSTAPGPTGDASTPTIADERAEQTAHSLAQERQRMATRRGAAIGAAGLVLAALIALLLWSRMPSAPDQGSAAPAAQTPTAAASTAQPTAAPAAQAPTAAAPTAQPTAAPAAQAPTAAAPTAIPAQQPAAGLACNAITGLPVYTSATCIDQDSDEDNGVIKLENTYTTNASADEVRRFYESAFAQGGWAGQEFKYDVQQGTRRLTIAAEAQIGPGGTITTIKLAEAGVGLTAAAPCTAIAGLPAYPNAACVEHDIDQDDGVTKRENTYTTNASPDEVRRFYESAFAQGGWAGQEFKYDVQQGARRLTVTVETQPGPGGTLTRFTIAEK
jgi:hypothetical protein